tara:strand:+ start:20798 stop:21028 length:231 start_codon:yes stop_codon:yes gene_type:complete
LSLAGVYPDQPGNTETPENHVPNSTTTFPVRRFFLHDDGENRAILHECGVMVILSRRPDETIPAFWDRIKTKQVAR